MNNQFSLIQTPGDGHCLIHAIISSWKFQIDDISPPTIHSILCSIFVEAITNYSKYSCFLPYLNKSQYINLLRRYILQKHYNSCLGDIIPSIISNSLGINIHILQAEQPTTTILSQLTTPLGFISIQKHLDHYSAVKFTPVNTSSSSTTDINTPSLTSTPIPTQHPIQRNTQSSDNKPKVITYSKDFLLSLRPSATTIKRQTRKTLFKHNLWLPKSQPSSAPVKKQQNHNSILVNPSFKTHPVRTHRGIKLATINARSVRNKVAPLLHHVLTSSIDICAITESWISDDDQLTISQLRNDLVDFHVIPRTNRSGGGTAILFRKSLDVTFVDSGDLDSFEYSIWKLANKHLPIHIVIIYRPPYSSNHPITVSKFIEEFSTFSTDVLAQQDNCIFLGDFNIHVDDSTNNDATTFKDLLTSLGLLQHVTFSTHINNHTLDLIICNDSDLLKITNLSAEFFLSDHCFVCCDVNIPPPPIKVDTITYRKLNSINQDHFIQDLQTAANSFLGINSTCVDSLSTLYYKTFSSILDKHAPLKSKTISIRKQVPWFDSTALNLKRKKRKLETKWRRTKSLDIKADYLAACSEYKLYLNHSKENHINNMISECGNNPKHLYKVINHLTGRSPNQLLPDAVSNESLANTFNQFFYDKITKIRDSLDHFDSYMPPSTSVSTFNGFTAADPSVILKLITTSKPATCQSDPLPTKIIKQHPEIFTNVITKLVNASLATSTFALPSKNAIISPLLKKPKLDRNLLTNYRPISNLSFVSKITEKAVLHQLCPYIESNNLLPTYQSAYRKYYSTETATIKIINDILWNMENQAVTSLIGMDLSAAFDTVDHDTLLLVLQRSFGLNQSALAWVDSYLRPRKMQVKINDSLSNSINLPFSVPQGSAAGPILYTAYASTMQHTITNPANRISGYADDHIVYTKFSSGSPNNEDSSIKQQEDCINNIRNWMCENRLKMNDSKTEFLLCGSRFQLAKCKTLHFKVGDTQVPRSDQIKYLGVLLDANLTFKNHILQKCKIASINLRNIKSLRKHLTIDSCKTLVQGLVISHLDYSNALFADLPSTTLKPAQLVQNHAAKVILGLRKFDSATEALKQLHWLPIRQRCIFKLLLLVYKSLHNQAPSYLSDLLVKRQSTRTTRSSSEDDTKLIEPFTARSTFASNSFSVAGPRHWNSLPASVRQSPSVDVFRRRLKTHLFDQYFNPP